MRPLSLDDLLPLQEYAGKRREYFESHRRYLDRYRRVRVGPLVTLLFENRQTLWFRVQEVVHIARLGDPQVIQHELDLFNRLLPGPHQLQATLLIEVKDPSLLGSELAPWAKLDDGHIHITIGSDRYAGVLLTCRPEDRCIGTSHWLRFTLDEIARQQLADLRQPTLIEFTLPDYSHSSAPLSEEIRESLADDLKMAAA